MNKNRIELEYQGKLYLRQSGQWIENSSRLAPPSTIKIKLDRLLSQKPDFFDIPPATALLFFWVWKNYLDDMKELGESTQLNQDNKLMSSLRKGDRIWAFTRRDENTYALAMDLVVDTVRINIPSDPGAKYGKYCVVGSKKLSRYFNISLSPDVEPLIRTFDFFRKDSKVEAIGTMFEGTNGVRELKEEEHTKLLDWSKNVGCLQND
jgi:hypothetical protein